MSRPVAHSRGAAMGRVERGGEAGGAGARSARLHRWRDRRHPAYRNPDIGRSAWPLREAARSEEHTSELQSQSNLVCRLLLEKKNLGPSGVVLVIVRKDLYPRIAKSVPAIFNFQK